MSANGDTTPLPRPRHEVRWGSMLARWRGLPGWIRASLEVPLAGVLAFVAYAADSAILTADLRKPTCSLADGGDGVSFAAMHFKGMADNAWYLDNRFLGAPFGMDLRDFPAVDLPYTLTIKALTLLTSDWVLTWNLFAIFSYPVTAMAAFAVMRHYRVGLAGALASAVLFALLPYHQFRAYGHMHIATSYFGVAIASVPALELLAGRIMLIGPGERRVPRLVLDRPTCALLAIAVWSGLWGQLYYTFFAIVLVLGAGVVRAARDASIWPALRGACFSGITGVALLTASAPSILHQRFEGRVFVREPSDAERFGLKLIELVLPQPGHRLEAFRILRQVYDKSAPLTNENITAALGIVGSIGFIVLIVVLLRGTAGTTPRTSDSSAPRGRQPDRELLWSLAVLNAIAVLLGTIGGVGSMVAYLGFPEVRSYNRISVCIGFFALFAVAILIERGLAALRNRGSRAIAVLVLTGVTVLGVYDQTFEGTPDYGAFGRQFEQEGAFVQRVESTLPRGASIFQLPYHAFPEGGTVSQLIDYGHLVAYLHSRELRYSYGALRGRRADALYRELAATPDETLAEAVTIAGYDALWLDRRGYADRGAALEATLRAQLGPPLATDAAENRIVWRLDGLGKKLEQELGGDAIATRRRAREALFVAYHDGFRPLRIVGGKSVYFAHRDAKVFFTNPTNSSLRVHFVGNARAAHPLAGRRDLAVSGLWTGHLEIEPTNRRLDFTIDVPPGTHALRFRTDAQPWFDDSDSHTRAVVYEDMHVEP